MLDNIVVGKYYPKKSKIHTLSPLGKILSIVIFIIMCFFINDYKTSISLALLVFVVILNTKIPFKVYFKTIWSIKILLLFIILITYFSSYSIEYTFVMTLKTILMVLYTNILTLTTTKEDIARGLEQFLFPLTLFYIRVNRIALSISLALRFIPSIIDEANKILKSQASRGIDYNNSNFIGKFKALFAILIPLFRKSITKADMLAEAMEVRLYNIDRKRTYIRENSFGFTDAYIVSIHVIILFLFILRRYS